MLNKPAIGQIGLIPGDGSFVAKLINWATRSKVHHVIICVSETTCVEAQPGGVIESPLTKWPQAIWSDFPLTPMQAAGAAKWALDHVGVGYGWFDDAAIGITLRFSHWIGAKIEKFFSCKNMLQVELQCAQLGDAALTEGAGFKVFDDGRDCGSVYPGSFVPIFKKFGWWPGE